MEIGLFGGSFNPPHVCHTLVTVWALETRELDEVWWIPTYEHAFGKDLVDYEHRRRMCQRALRRLGDVRISDIEQDIGGESRTIDTVRELERRQPDDDLSLIVGSDILEETDEWKAWEELVDRVELVVVHRSGYDEEADEGVDFWLPDVSSTDIREAIRKGNREALDDWMAASVLRYVDEHELYGGEGGR